MAKIKVELDTKTYELKATVDGVDVPNVDNMSIYKYTNYDGSEKYSVGITSCETNEAKDVRIYHTIMAKSLFDEKKIKAESKQFNKSEDIVIFKDKSPVDKDVAAYYENRKKS